MEGRISAPCPQLAPLGQAKQASAAQVGARGPGAERCALIRACRCSGTSPRGTTSTSPQRSRWSLGAGSGSAREAARVPGCAVRARGAGQGEHRRWPVAWGTGCPACLPGRTLSAWMLARQAGAGTAGRSIPRAGEAALARVPGKSAAGVPEARTCGGAARLLPPGCAAHCTRCAAAGQVAFWSPGEREWQWPAAASALSASRAQCIHKAWDMGLSTTPL